MEQILQNIVFEEIEYKFSNPELKLGLLFRLKSGETIGSILEKLENLEKLVMLWMEKLEINMLKDFDSRRRYKRNIKDDYFGVNGNSYYRPQQPTTILLELLQQPGSSSNSIALDDLKIQIPAKNVVERVSLSPVLGNEFLTQAQHVYKDYEGVFNVLPKKEDKVIILVKLIDGKVIPLRVGASETAFDVKVKIFVKEGNPTAFQRLFFAGKQLKNEPFIGIQMLSTLQLMLPLPGGKPLHFIKCMSGGDLKLNGCVYSMDISAENVSEIKNTIFRQKNIPSNEQFLHHRGKEISNDKNVKKIKSSIFLIHAIPNGVRVRVLTFKDISFQLFVKKSDTVDKIKHIIRTIEEISVEGQVHRFSGVYYRDQNNFAQQLSVKGDTTIDMMHNMIFQLTALSPEAQEIVFVDFRKHNASAIFDEMDTENQPIYYTPQTLIARAFVYIRSRDSTQAAEKAWAAALYSVKLLFLSLGVHNSSHRSNKWLAEFAIDTMNVEKRKNMKRLFEKAEFCHKIFCGSSRCSEDILFNLLEDIQDFVEEFRTIVRGDVQTKLDNFIDEKTTFDDGSIRFNAKQGKLAEFGGIVDLHYEYEFS